VKKRFTEEQIIGFLREVEAGVTVKDLCRRKGFSPASKHMEKDDEQIPLIDVLHRARDKTSASIRRARF
jgi:hypothetical protein